MENPPVKLLDRVRQKIRVKGYSIRTEKAYIDWIKRFIIFHGKRHPKEMGKGEIEDFLSHLAIQHKVASSTQNQAFNAILFLYDQVLEMKMPEKIKSMRSKNPVRVPTVMTREETRKVIAAMSVLMDGYDIRTIQDLLGHKDVSTTMIYTHVLNRGGRAVVSPLDSFR